MPSRANGVFYNDPIKVDLASFGPTVYTSTQTLTGFACEAHHEFIMRLGVHALLTTALTGTNNDLVFVARDPGAGGKSITITYVDPPGNNVALSVAVVGTDITVTLATDGTSTITSTAAQVKAAIEASNDANALVVVTNAAANDGTGVVTALAQTNLVDPTGSSPTLDAKIQIAPDGTNYVDAVTFAQKTIAATETKILGNPGLLARYVLTIGGTGTPTFPVSVLATCRFC